eukprot:TRINITY_DN15874_c0_g1_i2.p1 TRINITY_DN15874_c0_g1~~TRINITY_DN15874_c0_g1_i2.p1  ORF type:complete len:397 (+),score=53.32 TRINITY_DN15874_c0_g1_i2:533-1723(+)
MEDRMLDCLKSWLSRWVDTPKQDAETDRNRPYGICLGRDMNALSRALHALGLFHSLFGFTHCPRVIQDALRDPVDGITFRTAPKESLCNLIDEVPEDRPCVVVLTAGRHGLSRQLVSAFNKKHTIVQLVYISCNIVSLIPDVEQLLSDDCFVITNFRTFDFFPQTAYKMSYVQVERRSRTTLIIPVGAPGVGKSTLAALTTRWLPHNSVHWVERDAVFRRFREEPNSTLNAAKRQTHSEICHLLESEKPRIVGIDSTNGGRDGRLFYVEKCRPERVLLVWWESPEMSHDDVVSLLLARTKSRTRQTHAAFPEEEAEQRQKIETIMAALEPPKEDECDACTVLRCGLTDPEGLQALAWRLFLWAFVDPKLHTFAEPLRLPSPAEAVAPRAVPACGED